MAQIQKDISHANGFATIQNPLHVLCNIIASREIRQSTKNVPIEEDRGLALDIYRCDELDVLVKLPLGAEPPELPFDLPTPPDPPDPPFPPDSPLPPDPPFPPFPPCPPLPPNPP